MTFPKLPWWAWRRRAKRLSYLEHVAASEIRFSLNGVDIDAMTLAGAYEKLTESSDTEIVRGVAWATMCHLNSPTGDCAKITMRLPLDVAL